ncbi:hypothetical protein UVIVOLLU_CDS0062 [Salmonella phage PHA46_2]
MRAIACASSNSSRSLIFISSPSFVQMSSIYISCYSTSIQWIK